MGTHCGVVCSDVNQDLRGPPAADVSVAVPHAADQVSLAPAGEKEKQKRTVTFRDTVYTFHFHTVDLVVIHFF